MFVPLNYQLSIFGEYSAIEPSPEIIIDFMSKMNQEIQQVLLPIVVNSQPISEPSSKNAVRYNIGFISQDQRYSITILDDRIDINYSNLDESDIDMKDFFILATKVFTVIIDYFSISSNRLAMNILQVHEMENVHKLEKCGKSLLKSAAYYKDKDFVEWAMRTNAHTDILINGFSETLNVITDISYGQHVKEQKAGVVFHIDINTLQQNQDMRFKKKSIESFIRKVMPIASELIVDNERLLQMENSTKDYKNVATVGETNILYFPNSSRFQSTIRSVVSKTDSSATFGKEIFGESKVRKNIISRYINEIKILIRQDEFIDGEFSQSELYMDDAYDKGQIDYVTDALMEIYTSSLNEPHMLEGILTMISSVPYEIVYPKGQIIAAGLLENKELSVRDKAIQCFEKWNSKKGLIFLKNIHCTPKWLQKYTDRVIMHIERDGTE